MVSGATAVDTAGFGKVTLIYSATTATVTVKHGDVSTSVSAATGWVIDPATGNAAGTNPPDTLILSYVGSKRYITATDALVLLSEPAEY